MGRAIHSCNHDWWEQSFPSFARDLTGPWQGYGFQKKPSFRILVGIHCHNIPTHTPRSGYHGVTEVTKTTNIAKNPENRINARVLIRLCPIKIPWSRDTEPLFSAQTRKKQKIHEFRPKKSGRHFPTILTPNPAPHLPEKFQKVGLKWGVYRGNSLGDALIGQHNDFTRGETNNSTP